MSAKLVTYTDFNPQHLQGSEPESKTITAGTQKITYNDIKLCYNYGTEEDPIINDFYLELPECWATGIKYRDDKKEGAEGPYVKRTASMMIKFDLSDPSVKKDLECCLETLDQVFSRACEVLGQHKVKVKMAKFDPKNPGDAFKDPVYWPISPEGERIKGRNPNMWVSLKTQKTNKTLFTNLKDGKPVDWSLLENVDVKFLPLIHFEKIFVGTKTILKVHLASAILLNVVQTGTVTRQLSTMDRLKEKYGNLGDEVEAQLAQLRMARQDQLTQNNECATDTNTETATHSVHKVSSSNSPTDTTSLNDFLGAAPSMGTTMPGSAQTSTTAPTLPSFAPRLNVQVPSMKIN